MGPKVDGKGQDSPKPTTPEASVDGVPSKGVPGGESSGGKGIETTGPNPGGKK